MISPETDRQPLVAVRSDRAPEPVGPYSQAISHGTWLFTSGQIPIDPSTGRIVVGDVETQSEQVIANLAAVLEAGGSSLAEVVRTTVYLTDLSNFSRVNAVYAKFFTGDPAPARSTVEVSALPLGAAVEVDAIAITGP